MAVVEPIRKIKDIRKIEQILKKQSLRNLLFFTIGTNCGLRISDILALNVNDVKNKSFIQLKEKKTGKFKKIPINAKLKPMIKEFTSEKSPDEALFKTKFGNRLTRIAAYFIIRNACLEAGLKDNFGTHTMRKTFGYHYYKRYKDIVMLQKIFKHSTPETTLRYIGIEQDKINESCAKFII